MIYKVNHLTTQYKVFRFMNTNKPLLIAICFFLTALLGVVLIWPKYQDFKAVNQKISQKRAEVQYREEYSGNLKELSNQLKEYSNSLSKIDSILPATLSLPALFDYLQKTSAQSGLILKSLSQVSSQTLEEKPEIRVHSLSLSLFGSYSSFKNFLSALEKSARFIDAEAISLTASEGKAAKESALSFNLKIKFYSY